MSEPETSQPLIGVVAAHGPLANALVEAAEQISGVTGALVAVSNTGCDREAIEHRITEAINGVPAIVFVDMPSGSCLVAAMRRMREENSVRVITGVNLSMLVDFVFHRSLPLDEAAARAGRTGTNAIRQS